MLRGELGNDSPEAVSLVNIMEGDNKTGPMFVEYLVTGGGAIQVGADWLSFLSVVVRQRSKNFLGIINLLKI